jgi:phosphoribosylformylglycinamidine (FGAM) synthase PurS component
MPSKIEAEATRYKAQLNRTLKDGKVTDAEAKAILKEAESAGFTEVKGLYLTGFLDRNADKFDPKARKEVEAFVKNDLARKAQLEGEVGATGGQVTGEPSLTLSDKRAGGVEYKKVDGVFSVGGITPDDPLQGALGDCYFISSLASVAAKHPELLEKAVKTNRDGTYTVTLYERPDMTKPARPVQVTVDGKFPEKSGQLEYISARERKELWPLVFEKAYAQWKGGYGNIEGGMGANALTAITGAPPTFFPVSSDVMSADDVFAKLQAATANGGCVVADSKSFGSPVKGMISDHTYSVLGVSEENGQKYVTVRNPWGEREVGSDGKDDGVFKLTADQFINAFEMVEYVRP